MLGGSSLQLVCLSAIAERIRFGILKDAHRQIHAENAGGAAGGAGPCVATEQFRHYERTFAFRCFGPKRWHSASAPGEDWGKCRSVAGTASRGIGASSENPRSRSRSTDLERPPYRARQRREGDVQAQR